MKLYKLKLPLKNVIRLADHFFANREIGILKSDGFGEVSPLPYFNSETFEDIQSLERTELPSLNWGLYNAKKKANQKKLKLSLSGLILESEKSYLYKAVEYEKLCYKTIKLKVGTDLKLDREKIFHICKATDGINLRLDFNSRGSIDGLDLFLNELPADRIDYIEDPLPSENFEQLELLYSKTKIPYAIDYHNQIIPSQLIGLKAFIVKPMRVPVEKIKELQNKFTQAQIILSSSFESNLGLFHIAKLAFELGLENLSHGLDTQDYFKENLFVIEKKLNELILPTDEFVNDALTEITNKLEPIK